MLIFDIGANVGNWAIANQKGNVVVSVEAAEDTFNTLKDTVKEYPNIIPVWNAVCYGDTPTVEFHHCEQNCVSTLNSDWINDPKSRFYNYCKYTTFAVPRIGIDDLINKFGTPEYIKVDVEAAEDIVLKSLTTKVKVVAFEWAAEMRDVAYRTIEHLCSIGFKSFHVQLEDEYTYFPQTYEYNSVSIVELLKITHDGGHWGMIFAT